MSQPRTRSIRASTAAAVMLAMLRSSYLALSASDPVAASSRGDPVISDKGGSVGAGRLDSLSDLLAEADLIDLLDVGLDEQLMPITMDKTKPTRPGSQAVARTADLTNKRQLQEENTLSPTAAPTATPWAFNHFSDSPTAAPTHVANGRGGNFLTGAPTADYVQSTSPTSAPMIDVAVFPRQVDVSAGSTTPASRGAMIAVLLCVAAVAGVTMAGV